MDIGCGPLDRSLLYMQDDHISSTIWAGGDRGKIDVRQQTTRMGDWVLDDEQRHLLDSWGFGVFAEPRVVPQNDISLITALVERWRPETNSFHFPFGELTITLEDVYMIMGLPISGRVVTHTELQSPQEYWINQWEDKRLDMKARKEMWSKRGSAVSLHKLRERYGKRPKTKRPDYMEQDVRVYTRAYLFYIIGGILFPMSSRDVVHPRYLQLLQRPRDIIDYAWGAAVLAYLYRGLCRAARKPSTSINGCTMLLQLWAYERLLPGRPEIAYGVERVWPRALAWVVPLQSRRVNPHHHIAQYRGDFDSFDLQWLTWQPYAHFYGMDDIDQDDDADLHVACHMALGRIPMIAFEIVEYQMPDRVLRQFGILQHIPEDPIDMSFLRAERVSSFQRDNHTEILRLYLQEWDSFVTTGMPITVESEYVPISEYMHWFRRVSKLRIGPFMPTDSQIIRPRDWYSQQHMADALESAMRMAHKIHSRGAPDWFYDEVLPDFLSHYDRVNTEWKGLAFERPSFVKPQPPSPILEQSPLIVEQPPHVVPSSMEIDPSAPPSSVQTPLVVSQKRSRDADTEVQTSGPHSPLRVSPKRLRGDDNIETETSAPDSSLQTPASTSQTLTCGRIIVQDMSSAPVSSEWTPTSIPTVLRDHFDIDSNEDKLLDAKGRGGRERSGDMTRPLKNRKIRWLYRNWWSVEGAFEWREHGGRVTYILNWNQVQSLKAGHWIQDDVLNAYLELLKIREFELFGQSSTAKKYFFAPSFFFHRAMWHCPDLEVHPEAKTPEGITEQNQFFTEFHRQFTGPDLVECDYAFFPACTGAHWILFIVDVQHSKVSVVDSLCEDKDYPYRKLYPTQFYIMEKLLPCMLHHLDRSRFPEVKFMKVKVVQDRPKQQGGSDCGVYVAKYVDAMCCGIQLNQAHWDPISDILTFRYRIAHELRKGAARHICDWGVTQRLNGI